MQYFRALHQSNLGGGRGEYTSPPPPPFLPRGDGESSDSPPLLWREEGEGEGGLRASPSIPLQVRHRAHGDERHCAHGDERHHTYGDVNLWVS